MDNQCAAGGRYGGPRHRICNYGWRRSGSLSQMPTFPPQKVYKRRPRCHLDYIQYALKHDAASKLRRLLCQPLFLSQQREKRTEGGSAGARPGLDGTPAHVLALGRWRVGLFLGLEQRV